MGKRETHRNVNPRRLTFIRSFVLLSCPVLLSIPCPGLNKIMWFSNMTLINSHRVEKTILLSWRSVQLGVFTIGWGGEGNKRHLDLPTRLSSLFISPWYCYVNCILSDPKNDITSILKIFGSWWVQYNVCHKLWQNKAHPGVVSESPYNMTTCLFSSESFIQIQRFTFRSPEEFTSSLFL